MDELHGGSCRFLLYVHCLVFGLLVGLFACLFI